MKKGDFYNAKLVEDSIDQLSQSTGLFGYAFTEVNPEFQRDREALTMTLTFNIAQAQRTYVERIEINGNVQTQDKVIRREIRLNEGDAFNSFQVKRSQDRLNSLGYFQDKLEIKQTPGSSPDRVVLETTVEERSTGELQLSAGFSSLERFILQANITQRNFRGKGQELRAGVNYSSFSKSVELGFTEPYLFDKNIAIGVDVFRRDFNSFNPNDQNRDTTYSQVSTGFQVRAGVPLTEYWALSGRYGLSYDEISLGSQFFENGICNAGRYLCEQIGNRYTSSVGFSLSYDSLNSRLRPTAGQSFSISGDFAGLGGDVKYLRGSFRGSKFWNVGSGFIFSVLGEGGYIHSLEDSRGPGIDKVRITDRFFLGEPQFRGFDIRGVGPRVRQVPLVIDPVSGAQVLADDPLVNTENQGERSLGIFNDALGGRAYYLARAELEIPLGSGARELGLRPSIYVQAGSLFKLTRPLDTIPACDEDSSRPCFPVTTDAKNNRILQPLITPILSATGQTQYIVPTTEMMNPGTVTICQTGSQAVAGGPCTGTSLNTLLASTRAPFREQFLGNSPRPRLSIGAGVNWNSPFGPLRIDIARALIKQRGDDDKLITFNVGTQF
jgi:outer membrane protein insertion porin family